MLHTGVRWTQKTTLSVYRLGLHANRGHPLRQNCAFQKASD